MAAPSDQIEYQIETISGLAANMAPDQLDNQTPCSNWTVRDLMGHLVGGGQMFGALLQGDAPPADEGQDPLGNDPRAAWDAAAKKFAEGIDSPGALEREVPVGPMQIPGAVLLEIVKFDLLVHAWDLAQATGQTVDPPAEVVEQALSAAQQTIAPPMRDGDTFTEEKPAPPGADRMTQLVAFTGRDVT